MSSKKAQKQRQREPRLRLELGRVLGTVHPLWLKVEVAKSTWSGQCLLLERVEVPSTVLVLSKSSAALSPLSLPSSDPSYCWLAMRCRPCLDSSRVCP